MRAQAVAFDYPDELTSIETLRDSELAEWDDFVRRHHWGLVCHLSGWKRAIEETFPHIQGQIVVLRSSESGAIVAGIPSYQVRSRFLGNRTVSIPFATLSDPLVNTPDQMKALVAHLSRSNTSMRISAWRAATALNLDNAARGTGFLHHFLSLDSPFERLAQAFSKTAVRQMVVRAQRAGVDVESYGDEAGLKAFYDLYCVTRHRLGLPAMPFQFFDSLYRHLGSERVLLLHARKDKQILGSVLAFRWKDVVAVECMGEGPGARKLGVNQLLWWEAIRKAYEGGHKIFSFGRTHQSNKGLVEFKRRWGTQEELLPVIVQPVPTKNVVYTAEGAVTRLLRRLTSATPEALYLRFSAVCYRHLG